MRTQTEQEITRLKCEIADVKCELAKVNREYRSLLSSKSIFDIKVAYYKLSCLVRRPWQASLPTWPLFVFAIGPSVVAAFFFIATNELTGSWTTATFWSGWSAIGSIVILSHLLYVPPRAELPALHDEAIGKRRVVLSKTRALRSQVDALKDRAKNLTRQRELLLRSDLRRREELLLRNWRAMRDYEWEEYLAEVFHALGARVQRTGRSGDQGVDLIVEIGTKRIAVQAKGYYNSVSGSAVQEAVAGVAHYRCNASAVITNSRFTKGAIELAASNRCVLIGEAEIPDFVLGKLPL